MKRIHFIAIGGAIMHQLAIALQKQGYRISGSDDEINDPARSNLADAGLLPSYYGWNIDIIDNSIDAVVLGMHARADNPELIETLKHNIPVFSFPEYVYEVSKAKTRVVIAGSHGKTTITSMVMHILKNKDIDFDYLVGARVPGFDQSVRLSDAPLIILEGDEYPASVIEKRPKIFFYHPHITALSGIAWDHINVFPTYENYFSQFVQYVSNLEPETKLIYNEEDSEVVRVSKYSTETVVKTPYSTPPFQYRNGKPVISFENNKFELSVFGRHNVSNAEAAVTVCESLGTSRADGYAALADFTGAAKRLEKIKEEGNLLVYRDFAHAPSKLKATLNAVREAYPDHYLIAVFELHTFSSLNEQFLSEYSGTMDQADKAIVFYSLHALEMKNLPDLKPESLVVNFSRNDLITVSDKVALYNIVSELLVNCSKPVFLLLMSSGTFEGIDWNSVSSQINN